MATYLFECEHEDHIEVRQVEAPMRFGPEPQTCLLGHQMRRDYLGENAGIDRTSLTPDHVDRVRKHQKLFLPEAKDFAGPGDPDGIKGLKAWQDNHQPRPSNRKPAWPTDAIGGARTSF